MKLSKYHGLGNDFILGKYQDVNQMDLSELAVKVCDRHTGIGADGLIIVKEQPLEMIYYNSDGSRAEMCGNGIRCFANYIYDESIQKDMEYPVVTLAGIMKLNVTNVSPFTVTVNMGKANYEPKSFYANIDKEIIDYELTLPDQTVLIDSLLLGVPHTAFGVENLSVEEIEELGPQIEKHPLFTQGTNVNFYQLLSKNHIKMQTYERGAGLTLACGTGACATFAILQKKGLVTNEVTVSLPLGDLTISINEEEIYMNGPAQKVCDIFMKESL